LRKIWHGLPTFDSRDPSKSHRDCEFREYPVNVAFVLSCLADHFGGPVTVVKGLGSALARSGHNISYWATTGSHEQAQSTPVPGSHTYETNWPHRWYRSRALARGLRTDLPSIDMLHVNGFWPHPVYMSSRLAHKSGTPYILCPSGALEPWRLRSTRFKWLKKEAYLRSIGKSVMKCSACLHACSAQEAEHFRRAGHDGPVAIIPNGIDISEFTAADGDEAHMHWPDLRGRPVVLFLSRLSPEKGLDLLIRTWAELVRRRAHREAILMIAGPDDRGYRKTVEAMIEKNALQRRIVMSGMIRGRGKAALLRRADVLVLPSYSENFGIVVAEALACGTPVITTTGTPWNQLQSLDAGRWVAPEASELAGALRELLDMPESQRQAMGQRGRKLVEQHYTWDKVVGKFLTVCDCILRGGAVPLHPEPMELIPSESQSLLPFGPPAAGAVR
jgi:glycosyltransferase involved in cell wall biosynthesis